MDAARLLAPSGAPGQAQQYQQGQQQPAPAPLQQQGQQQPAPAPSGTINIAPALPGAPGSGTEGYDLSSLEQLQAHALQLSASAGLTNLLLPNGHQGQQNQQQGKHQPFIFLQPANANQGLQPLAAMGTSQDGSNNNGTNGNSNAPTPAQNFLLAAPGPGGAIAANAQQLFAAASGGPATLTLAPNGTLQPQQQSYSSSGIPIPMPMIIPQQQGQQQAFQPQPQLQPLQPAPAAVAGTKRVHDASVVSTSTMSLESGGAANTSTNNLLAAGSSSMNMNMNDFPEFQLRNKDGSIITEKDLEKMSPAERRRYERNLREQQRSFRISQQIQQLRDVLAESKVPFKPNKYSILVSVADYIKQLQTRAIMLDSEHKKLFKTIQETNEMVASGQIPDANAPAPAPQNGNVTNDQGDLLIVQGLDYQAVFEQTPTANGVASIDGRILACNQELENILECSKAQIERQSLFTLVQNHQEIFEAMAELLKRADALSNGSLKADPVQLLYWSGRVVTPDDKKLGMNITLACTKDGSPKFFSFCMSPA